MLSMIAGMAHNRVIGKDNQLPWHLPADLGWFKRTTMGKPIIMGRKTHESIGKPLPGRQNIIISTNTGLKLAGCDVVNSPEAAIELVQNEPEIMVIGGALIYELFLPHADRLYLTHVDAEIDGDAFFPDYEAGAEWEKVFQEDHIADERNAYNYSFQQLNRIKS
ncbi:MAG: type 3 dihydrofolate reductase [Thiotrichaceae bacterium]